MGENNPKLNIYRTLWWGLSETYMVSTIEVGENSTLISLKEMEKDSHSR